MSKLRAAHLAKAYKKRQVISDLSSEVESGQIVGLLGPNGAGKTTAFYMIVGLVPPDAGVVTIDDRDITHLAMHQRAHAGIGYLPQEASVFRKLTVEDNIMAILETRDQVQDYDVADYVDLYNFCDLLAGTISKGPLATACQGVMDAIREPGFVIASGYKGTGVQHSYGLAVYFPR